MSVVAQYQQWLNTVISQKISETLQDPTIVNYAGHIQNSLINNVSNKIWPILRMLYDTNALPLDQTNTPNLIHKYIRGCVAQEFANMNSQAPQQFVQDYHQISSFLNEVKMKLSPPTMQMPGIQSGGYGGPTYVTPAMNNSPVLSGGAFVTAPPNNSLTTQPPTMDSLQFFVNDNISPGNDNMNKDNHLPDHMRQNNMYAILTEPAPKVQVESKPTPPVFEPSTDFVRIKVKNFTDMDINPIETSIGCSLYLLNKEALTMPSAFIVHENKWIPTFNSNQELAEEITELPKYKTVDEMFNALEIISKRHSIPGFLAWLDQRISLLVEKTLHYRFGLNRINIPNYRTEYRDIDKFLDKKGIKEEIHAIILQWFSNAIIETNSMSIEMKYDQVSNNKDINYLEIKQRNHFVTLPWVIDFDYQTNTPSISGVSINQLYGIMDDCWKIFNNNDIMSVIVLDISNNRYRVYRKGNMQFNPSEYTFEWLGF